MIEGFIYTIDNKRLRCAGLDYGWGDRDPFLVQLGHRYLVARVKGGMDWDSVGESVYTPSCWFLCKIEKISDTILKVLKVIRELEPGNNWRKMKKGLIRLFEELENAEEEK